MKPLACAAPIYRGPLKGLPATGTKCGYMRHHRAGEALCDECAAARRIHQVGLHAANPEPAREASRRWRAAHTAEHAKRNRKWVVENRDKQLAKKHRRRARLAAAPTISFSIDELALRMSMFGNACWMCGGAFEAVDHVKPLAAGGWHCLSNLRPACHSCNSKKWARWPLVEAA